MCVQLAEERISNMRTVRAFGKELVEVSKYIQKTDQVFTLAKKEAVIRAGFFGVVSLHICVCVCVLSDVQYHSFSLYGASSLHSI